VSRDHNYNSHGLIHTHNNRVLRVSLVSIPQRDITSFFLDCHQLVLVSYKSCYFHRVYFVGFFNACSRLENVRARNLLSRSASVARNRVSAARDEFIFWGGYFCARLHEFIENSRGISILVRFPYRFALA